MRCTSDKTPSPSLVLYHAVSSYQLLEVMLHRLYFHPDSRAILLLPDFIVKKYPQYKKLTAYHFFDEVYLFPYLHIPHREESQIIDDTARCYRETVPHAVTDFSTVYVAGAHFYFSLYLIQNQIPFVFLEDAAGMLSRPEELYLPLQRTFPIHAAIARRHGLFDGDNPCVTRIICLKRAQTIDVSGERYQDFSVEDALEALPARRRKTLIRFFLRRRIRTRAQGILLTQRFAGLGVLSEEEQQRLYERLRDGPLHGVRLLIKPHPDDTLSYADIFPRAEILRAVFPSELLPYVFWKKPETLYTFSSTGCENLRRHFIIHQLGRDPHAACL